MPTRRTFLVTGVAGTAALVTAYWLHRAGSPPSERPIDRDAARSVLTAVAPIMLEGALPEASLERDRAVQRTVGRVESAIDLLPLATQHELAQLFALLSWPPSRIALTGLSRPWHEASSDAVRDALAGLRDSAIALKRSGYAALHQLVLGAWYAGDDAWARIGYPGPPTLAS